MFTKEQQEVLASFADSLIAEKEAAEAREAAIAADKAAEEAKRQAIETAKAEAQAIIDEKLEGYKVEVIPE